MRAPENKPTTPDNAHTVPRSCSQHHILTPPEKKTTANSRHFPTIQDSQADETPRQTPPTGKNTTTPTQTKKTSTQQYNKQTAQYLQNAILSLETRVQHPNTRHTHTPDHPHGRLIKRIKISHASTPIWRMITSISMLQQERRVQITRRTTTIRKTVRTLPQRFLHILPSHMIILRSTKHQIYIMP